MHRLPRHFPKLLPTVALAAICTASGAQAHSGGAERRSPDKPAVERGMFGQQPLAMPAQQRPEPSTAAAPRAKCLPGSTPEPGIQGRVAAADIASGKAAKGYQCNISQIGQSGATGGFKVLRYTDRNGHECAYYDTTLLFPTNVTSLSAEPTGVAVLDMSDPKNPKRTDSLLTPAMQSPHESVNLSIERGLLAAVAGNAAFAPGVVDVYDISQDCRRPVLQASSPVGLLGHESGMALDGKTFYATSIGTGQTTAVDLTNPRVPVPLWVGQYDSHGLSLSDDGNRAYMAAGSGLIILDVSEIQARKPNPQVREISRLVWPNITIPQIAIPVTIKGKPYLVEVDEFSASAEGSTTAHGDRVGAARIIDIADETKPFVVSNIRLQVHQPESRPEIAGDPGARSPVQGYAGHYCNVPQRKEPGIFACSMILSGLRVFDIRDVEKPKEIGYFVAPPSTVSASGGPVIDERANWAMSSPAFAPERGEIWYSDGTSGFYALKINPRIWPFASSSTADCTDKAGLASASVKASGRNLSLRFTRRSALPVNVDVFRVSKGRTIIEERLVARFSNRRSGVTWKPKAGAGYYFARFTMLENGKPIDTRRVVFERDASGRTTQRRDHYRRDSCGLLGKFKLERPVFGGFRRSGLGAAYRLSAPAKVTITVLRGRKVVKRFPTVSRSAGKTLRVALPGGKLPKGDYTIRLLAQSGEDQIAATLVARRL